MPKYEIDVPGQGTFEVDSPTELTDYQAYQAVLGQIRSTPPEPKGILAGLQRGTRGMVSSMRTGAESLLPEENAGANAAIKGLERQAKIGEELGGGPSTQRLREAFRKDGMWGMTKEAIMQVPEAIAEQAPVIGGMVAGAKLGSFAGPWGAVIGGAVTPLVQFYGSNLERQAAEQIEKGDPVDVDRGTAAMAAAPQMAIDLVQQRLVFGQRLFSKALGIPEKELLKKNAAQVEKLAKEKLLPTLAYGTVKGAAVEIPTEIAQQMIERAQAGLDITTPDALAEYGETAYKVGLLGPLGAVGRMSEKGAARRQLAAKAATPPTAPMTAPSGYTPTFQPPVVTPPAAPVGQMELPLEGAQEVGPRMAAPIAPQAALPDEATISTLRDQYDTLSREIERLGAEFERTQDPAKKQELLVQGQRLDFARRDINTQLKKLGPAPITTPEGQMALDFTQPEPEVDLTYYQPKTRLAEPTIIGQQPAAVADTSQLRLDALRRMRDAGEALTPAEQFQLRELEKAEQAKPAPQFEMPVEVGTGARPTSYVVDDTAIDTFGLSKKATKLRDAIRGLDLMKAEDLEKFNDLVEKHERKPGAKIDMEAVDAFKQSIPESVPAREVPEAAGLPAREYTPRQQYQQAREAMFAFGQEAAPISPRDRAILARQKYEAENGTTISDVGTGTSEPSVRVPSGQLESTEGVTAPTTTGLAGAEPTVGRAPAGERTTREAKPAPLSAFEQMIQQVAPEGKPDLKEKKAKPKKLGFGEIEKPAPTRKGTAYREAGPNMTGMSVKDVQANVNRMVEGWKNPPLIKVVQRVDQLPQAIQRQIEQDNVERPQGVWDDESNAVFLIADNLIEPKDVALTVAHEALGHFGLRTILGENYSKVMNQAYRNNAVKRRADAKIARGLDKEIAVEEVLAEMAEKGEQPNLINRIINMIRNWLRSVGVDIKSVTDAEIRQLLTDARQYVIEGKGEAGKGGMKIGKVFSGDAPIFYSRLAAMTQHAPKNLRDGASGKAWADWINSNAGKFGVKKEEIEWSGIDDLLALMEKSLKFTSKDVNDMLKEEGVKVEEAVYGGGINVEAARKLRQEENRLNNLAFDLAEEMLTKNVFTPNTWYYKQAVGYNRDKAKPDAQLGDYLENLHVPILEGTFDTNLFDPDLEDTYTEKVRSIQKALANLTTEQDKVYGRTTRFDSYKTHGGENYTELVLTLPTDVRYNHPHWPGVNNPIAHARFSEFTDADGKRVILVDEVQSDWGQEGQESGFGTKATDEEYAAVVNTRAAAEVAYAQAVRRINQEQGTDYSETPVRWRPIPEELRAEAESVINLRNLAEQVLKETTRPPKAPFVQDTKTWTALVVKRLLRYAADNNIDRIAFVDGETAHKRFPTNKQGGSTEKGMKTYYDQILPSVVKDVLRKLGADSKSVESMIEFAPTRGYYVTANGQEIAGPFEYKTEAQEEGMRLMREEGVEITSMDIVERESSDFKRFMAYDIAPETAEKVKEGQAMFRSAASTPEGQQAEQLMGAFGGATPKENLKFVDRQKAKFEKAKDEWQSHYDQNQSWVGATFGKGQNIASFDQAFNNRLYNHFMALKKQGNMVMDEVKQALLRISTSQALHRQNLANQIIDRGNYSYDADANRWAAVDDPINMANFETAINKLATRLGVEPTRAKQIMGAAYEANRLDSMYKDLNRVQAELAQAEKDLLKLKDPKQRSTKSKLIDALKAKEEELEGKVRHKTPAQVAAGMQLYNSSPEIQEGTRIWNTMRERVIKMLVDTGVKTQQQAEAWLDEAAYVPFFRDMGEESRVGPKIMARGLRESMRDYRMKGSEKEVADVIDNMYKWMQWSIARSISNNQLQVMADNYAKYLPNEIKEGKSGSDSSFVIYRNGVPKYYTVADPAVGQAFTGLEPLFFPAINYMAAPSNFLRHAVTRNPIFAASQLFMDSYSAMFTSGLKNPFGLLKEIAKETVATIRGTSDTREMLKRSGILETHDYAALSEADAIGYRLNLDKPGAWAKLAQRLDKMAAGSDNVIRQGIYNQAIKEGLSPTEAMEKATEVVNFRRVSGSPTIQLLSRVVPFFNAYMQVASVAVKTLSGRGISPQERAEATKVLMATTAKIAALSMLYSMAVGDDEDYLKKNRVSRDRMWMIPGTGGFGIPVRLDVFALPKIAGEYGYQMMTDTAYADSKMVKSAIARAIKGTINPPSEGIPQLVRPALGVMMNYDSFQDREIVNATMRRLDPEMQYNKNTSEMAKALGAMTGISPLQLDFLMRGYLGSLATLTALGTNDIINAARGAPPRPERSLGDIIGSLPSVGGFMSKEENTAVLSDYYEVARDVNRAVDSLGAMKYATTEERRAYAEEHKKELALKGPVQSINKMLVNLKRREQAIREAPEARMSSERKQEELRKIDAQRTRLVANIAKIRKSLYD